MSILELHQIEDFKELFTDPRFVGLLMYLRKNRPRSTQKEPHGIIQDAGRLEAYLELIEKIEDTQRIPGTQSVVLPSPPYHNNARP